MALWRQLFGGREPGAPPSMPWDRRPSILEHVRSHLPADGPGLTAGGETLPDEDRIAQGSKIRWAAGALDGVATHHMGTGGDDEAVRKTVRLVVAYSRQPTATNKAAVYRHVIDAQIVSIVDPVIESLVNEPKIGHDRLYELARSFATESPDREPVKFGIALLGLFGQPQDRELFLILGRHEEFTLFCVVALANSPEHADESLWTLTRSVTGWGRIHAVERLARTEDPEIRRWLLREGYKNSVMHEYTAATCARAGGLLAALVGDDVDRGLLTAAGEILRALIAGGPAEGIDDYDDARPVVESYLGHMASSAETVEDFLHVHAIRGYLDEDDSRWADRYGAGWSPEVRDRLRSECGAILGRSEWPDRVRAKLGSGDELEFFHADRAARALGIDTWEVHRRRLLEEPADPGRWYHVMSLCDEARIGEILAFAESSIDLGVIATGAGDELGLGPGFEHHRCLDYVLQDLRRFPGRGKALIEAGLRSPVVRNRNMAVAALAAWPRATWPGGIAESLEYAGGCEPDEGVRDRMLIALKGEPLPS